MKRWLLVLAVAALGFGLFAPTLGGEFVYDDLYQIVENDQLRSLSNLPRYFTSDVWAAVGIPFSSYYRPLMYTTFAVEMVAAGPTPWVFRATNALLHGVACALLLVLLLRLRVPKAGAVTAALLFAAYPMHAEVVAWPSARPELLVTIFCLAAAVVHAGADAERGPTRARFLAVGAWTMLALLSKETGVLAPVLLGLVTMLRSPIATARGRLEAGVFAAFPYLALVLVFIGIRGLAIHVSSLPPLVGPEGGRAPFRAWSDAALAVAAIAGRYFGVMLVPVDPSSFRVPHWENIAWGLWMLPLAALSLVLAARNAAFAWLSFAFVAIALQSTGVPSAGYLSQRYAYLPSVGVCAFYGIALQQLFFGAESVSRRRAGMVLAAAMVIGSAVLLLPRAMDWTREPRLWARAIERDPDSPAPIANHAFMLLDAGRGAEALELFQKIEVVEPGAWMAPYGQANALAAMGRLEEAIPLYEKAIQRAPAIPYMYFSLGFVYEDLGRYDKAREAHEKGLELFPNSALSEGVLSTLEAKAGDPAVALKRTEDALSFRPDQPVLRLNRVVLLARTGRTEEAIKAAEELTEVKEIASEAHRQLAILYDRYRPDPATALTHYRESLALAPERPDREQIRRRIASLERTTR